MTVLEEELGLEDTLEDWTVVGGGGVTVAVGMLLFAACVNVVSQRFGSSVIPFMNWFDGTTIWDWVEDAGTTLYLYAPFRL